MNKPARKYTEDQISLLSGQIKGTRYVEDIQKELESCDKNYSDGYINRVIGGFSYNNDIWDAAFAVIKSRKQKKVELAKEMNQLVA